MPLQVRDLTTGADHSAQGHARGAPVIPSAIRATSPPALEAAGLTRRFGATCALRDVDLELHPGECVALLGPNGAGKTTLLRVLAGALRPTQGSVRLAGVDLGADVSLRRTIGVVEHQPLLYGPLTARENLRFFARLYGVEAIEERVEAVLDEVGLRHLGDRQVQTLSRGTQQRASLARAMLHEPAVLLLDEPEAGLDQAAQERVAALLRRWSGEGRAVLFASHRLEWAEMVADRAIVLCGGTVVGAIRGTPPLALGTLYRRILAGCGADAPPSDTWIPSVAPRAGMGQEVGSVRRSADLESAAPSVSSPSLSPVAGWASSTSLHAGEAGLQHEAPPGPVAEGTPERGSAAAGGGTEVGVAGPFPSPGRRDGLLGQLGALVRKDLLLEWRCKDAVAPMLVFVLLMLVMFNFALDLRPEVMATVGPGVLWVAVVFGSMLGPGRSFIREQEAMTLEGLVIAPVDRSALFLSKLVGNLIVMAGVQVVSVPVFLALFEMGGALGSLALVLVTGTLGLAAVETLLAAMAASTRAREVMLPVLLLPLIAPIVIGVVEATGLALGSETAHELPWLGLILAFDVLFLAAGVVVFEYVLEE